MLLEEFPDDMFCLREGESPMYGEFPELKAGVEYFKSLMTPDEWIERRERAARRFYESITGQLVDNSGKGRFFEEADQMAWYLFLGEAFTDHPQNYEVMFGSRVVPIFASIGRQIELIPLIEGFEQRAKRAIGPERGQPNGPLFELLVALAYAREGRTVRFCAERPGDAKTHDMDVDIDGKTWAIECKRLELGDYGESERLRMRELWRPAAHILVSTGRSYYLNSQFLTEMSEVPNDYFMQIAKKYLESEEHNLFLSDQISNTIIGELDLEPIQTSLSSGYLIYPGPIYHELLTGSYIRYDNLNIIHKVKFATNPHFIDEIDQAVVARWTSISERAIDQKAREFTRILSRATAQLPTTHPCIIHIGLEALGADEIERKRVDKIKSGISNFDFGERDVRIIYWNYFAAEASREDVWAMDETAQWQARSADDKFLKDSSLIIPPEAPVREGVHWDGIPNSPLRSP